MSLSPFLADCKSFLVKNWKKIIFFWGPESRSKQSKHYTLRKLLIDYNSFISNILQSHIYSLRSPNIERSNSILIQRCLLQTIQYSPNEDWSPAWSAIVLSQAGPNSLDVMINSMNVLSLWIGNKATCIRTPSWIPGKHLQEVWRRFLLICTNMLFTWSITDMSGLRAHAFV